MTNIKKQLCISESFFVIVGFAIINYIFFIEIENKQPNKMY